MSLQGIVRICSCSLPFSVFVRPNAPENETIFILGVSSSLFDVSLGFVVCSNTYTEIERERELERAAESETATKIWNLKSAIILMRSNVNSSSVYLLSSKEMHTKLTDDDRVMPGYCISCIAPEFKWLGSFSILFKQAARDGCTATQAQTHKAIAYRWLVNCSSFKIITTTQTHQIKRYWIKGEKKKRKKKEK